MPKRRAFTLIELLVVISIIALLIAILLPALGSARKSGRSAQCLSNTKQMGTALYTRQVDTKFSGFPYQGGKFKDDLWFNALMDYGFTLEGKLCPEADTADTSTPQLGGRAAYRGSSSIAWKEDNRYAPPSLTAAEKDDYTTASYVINSYNYAIPDGYTGKKILSLPTSNFRKRNFNSSDDMKNPANTPVFGDGVWRNSTITITDRVPSNPESAWPGTAGGLARWMFLRHPNRSNNVVFGDGHAAPVEINDLDQLTWYRGWEDDLGTRQKDVSW